MCTHALQVVSKSLCHITVLLQSGENSNLNCRFHRGNELSVSWQIDGWKGWG
jgi:hypothetical protein